jgi:hypothetical protein
LQLLLLLLPVAYCMLPAFAVTFLLFPVPYSLFPYLLLPVAYCLLPNLFPIPFTRYNPNKAGRAAYSPRKGLNPPWMNDDRQRP